MTLLLGLQILKENALINMLIALTKFTQAIKYYDKALAKNPNATDILNNKGLALLHLEKYNESLKKFDKVLSIDPKDAPSLYNEGISLDKLGNHTQAQYYQQKAQQINPQYVGEFVNRISITPSISTSISESIKKGKRLDVRNSFNINMTTKIAIRNIDYLH